MLHKNALIVEFSVSQWTARKLDKEVTDNTNNHYKAGKDAGRYNKLLASKEFTQPVTSAVSEARSFHYANTLPWGKKGQGLLSTKSFQKYVEKFDEIKTKFDNGVAEILRHLDDIKAEAMDRLGKMYKESDYPSRAEVAEKFEMSIKFFPVPEDDFRVKLSKKEIEQLKKEMGVEVQNRLADAVADTWKRVKKQLLHMRETLMDKDKGFHGTLFTNLEKLIETLPMLNITEDKDIDKLCVELQKIMADPDDVKQDQSLRANKAAEVQQVLNKFDGYFKGV